jgi:hypothetical protein
MHNLLDNYYLTANRIIRYLDSMSIYVLEFGSIPKLLFMCLRGLSTCCLLILKDRRARRDTISSYSGDQPIRK